MSGVIEALPFLRAGINESSNSASEAGGGAKRHYAGVAPVCVGGSGGCQSVQASSYATIFGVPVAALGLVSYSGLLLAALLRGEAGVYLGLLVALVGTLFSAYLTYLEVFVIHAICEWCVASAALMVGALICAAVGVWRLAEEGQAIRERSRPTFAGAWRPGCSRASWRACSLSPSESRRWTGQ
jgi:uncharacterized membrane protein